MRTSVHAIVLLAIVGTLFHGGPQQAVACSCAGLTGDEARVRESLEFWDDVVIGQLVSINETDDPNVDHAIVKVEQRFKGDLLGMTVEQREGSGASCGFEMDRFGERYFLQLQRVEGKAGVYTTNMCGAFAPSALPLSPNQYYDPSAFLATLARIAPPEVIAEPTASPPSTSVGFGDDEAEREGFVQRNAQDIITVAMIAAIVGIAFVSWRAHRRS